MTIDLLAATDQTLAELLTTCGVAPAQQRMRMRQIRHRLAICGAQTLDEMSEIPTSLRQKMAEHARAQPLTLAREQISADGTRKWLLQSADKNLIETVYIPDNDRGTVCISSQVGCTLSCTFCHTGTQRLVRNLTAAEIAGQVAYARHALGDIGQPSDNRRVTNIVLMGMGEPLYNFDAVKQAMLTVMDGDGIGIGKRRVTLSTSGVVPMMHRAGEEIGCNLAVSLHAVTDDVRDILVPLNKKYNIATLLEACRNYPNASNARRITFEYVMLDGINDSDADARGLVKLLRGLPAKVNLIPFNPWPGSNYACSPWERIEAFADIVTQGGYAGPIRTPRGRDILAACGQLKSDSQKQFKHTPVLTEA